MKKLVHSKWNQLKKMKNKENDILCLMNEHDFVYRQLSNFATTMSISNI